MTEQNKARIEIAAKNYALYTARNIGCGTNPSTLALGYSQGVKYALEAVEKELSIFIKDETLESLLNNNILSDVICREYGDKQ